MNKNLRLAMVSLALLSSNYAFATAGQTFLASRQAAAILADGRPWAAEAPDGKALKVTLKQDGTGSIRGPMPFALSITWQVMDDKMCISGKMGTKCLRFHEIPGGLQAWDGDKPDLKFSR